MTNKNRVWVCVSSMLVLCVTTGAEAAQTAASTLEKCQKMAQKETAKLVKLEQKALSGCLQKIAQKVVKDNQAVVDVSAATSACIGSLYKIGRTDGKSAADKMSAKVGKFCDPSLGADFKGLHTADDVLGTGAPGVNQPLDVSLNNDTYCGNFATGSATLAEWTACLQGAASCQARQQVLVEFPRAIEWLNLMDAQFTASSDSRALDAQAALQAAVLAMDANSDTVPDLACGPPVGLVPGVDPILPVSGQTTAYGAGSDGAVQAGRALSYTDNGDGTITDNNTGLMWEKKDDSGGIHDKDNLYSWSTGTPYNMDGTITTVFLAALNAGSGFAGHTDWRIPDAKELHSILDYEVFSPSVDPAFQSGSCTGCTDVTAATCSCTAPSFYWSSTTLQASLISAWIVEFFNGGVLSVSKIVSEHVRAVRGGL